MIERKDVTLSRDDGDYLVTIKRGRETIGKVERRTRRYQHKVGRLRTGRETVEVWWAAFLRHPYAFRDVPLRYGPELADQPRHATEHRQRRQAVELVLSAHNAKLLRR